MRIELRTDHIAGAQEGVDHRRGQFDFFLAQTIEQRLQFMGHFGHIMETEGTAAALDRMGGTKNRVQILKAGRLDVERQQQAFHARQILGGFIEKHLVELAEFSSHGRRL